MKKLISIIALSSLTFIAACNTMAGVGKDVKATGQVITETANDAKPN